MTRKWSPSREQSKGVVTRAIDFFLDELTDLQDELDCPDEFIFDLLGAIRDRWSPGSCHARMREFKKENPETF